MVQAQNRTVYMNYPDTVCLNNYASLHSFYRDNWDDDEDDYIAPDSVMWEVTSPAGVLSRFRVASDAVRPAPYLYANNAANYGDGPIRRGQSIMLDMNQVGLWTVKVTFYEGRNRNGSVTYTNTKTRTIRVIDCTMSVCYGSYKPNSNFIENFGQFTANGPRTQVTTGTIEYRYNGNPFISTTNTSNGWPLEDDWYTVYYNAIRGGRPEWDDVNDHTNDGLGGMLIANSSHDPKTFYSRDVPSLCPGAKYNFSAWFINLNSHKVLSYTCAGGDASYQYAGVEFIVKNKVGGAVIGRFYTGDVSMDLRRVDTTADAKRLLGWQKFGGPLPSLPALLTLSWKSRTGTRVVAVTTSPWMTSPLNSAPRISTPI